MDENKIKQVEKTMDYIQNIIERLANNQFTIKKYYITILIAVFGYSVRYNIPTPDKIIILVASAIIAFTELYYLYKERQYRNLYDKYSESLNENNNKLNPYNLNVGKSFEWFLLKPSLSYIIYLIVILIFWA